MNARRIGYGHRQVTKSENNICFIRDPSKNNKISDSYNFRNNLKVSKNLSKTLYLLEKFSYQSKLLEFLPKNFTIATNNSSCKFNISILENTSSVIKEFHAKNPDILNYHIDIDDKDNILEKFGKLYQGEIIIFDEDELPISKKITNALNIINCPNYMKPESLKTEEAGRTKNLSLSTGVGISYSSFDQFISNENNFTITTKSNEYKCNRYGVFSSKVIRELILKDPTTNTYNYDFDDENNEFQLICDIFNFQYVDITTNNMYSIKEMADDLQIDFIIPKLEKNIDESEKVSKMIDEHQTVVDTIEELFGQLYNIDQNTVESSKTTIVNSRWSKTEESVQELAAFIIQVVSKSIYLHPYIIDLMIQLDKASNETNKLNILIPFIIQKFFAYSIKIQRFSYCSFIYNLYKRGLVSKENLNAKIAKSITQTPLYIGFYQKLLN